MPETDRIEKRVVLRAPRERVWRAIANAEEFGTWFGAEFDAPFTAGATVSALFVTTRVDPDVAKMQEEYAGTRFDVAVERVEPMSLLSFHWHPEPDAGTDAPTTLVEFVLEDHPDGTLLMITESGFDRIPVARRTEAFKANEEGWKIQATLLGKYLAQAA